MPSIIKSQDQSDVPGEGAVVFQFDDIAKRADAYLEKVRHQAKEILQQAKHQADQLKAEAIEQGKQQGMADAQAKLESMAKRHIGAELSTVRPALEQAARAFETERQKWLARWEKDAVALAVAIAERIVRGELSQRPEIPLNLIKETLELAADCRQIRIYLHPQDLQALESEAKQLAQVLTPRAELELIADPNAEPGGCRAETEFGEIDQRIETQLSRIMEELA